MYHKSPARSTYSSEKVAYLIFPTVTVSLDLNSRYGSKVACDWLNNKTPPLNIKALTGRQEWFGYERLTTFMSWLGANADCNYCANAYKNLKIVNFCVFCKTQPHTPNKTREKKNRNKTHLTSHYHAHCPFDWSAGFSEAFRAHMIGWYWQQSRLIAKGLDGRLGGSQVSNVWGDNLRVDKNDLSQLKHFGTEFVLVFFFYLQVGFWTDRADKDYAIRQRNHTPVPSRGLGLTAWLHDHHTTEREESGTLLFKAS